MMFAPRLIFAEPLANIAQSRTTTDSSPSLVLYLQQPKAGEIRSCAGFWRMYSPQLYQAHQLNDSIEAAFMLPRYNDSAWQILSNTERLDTMQAWHNYGWFRLRLNVDSTQPILNLSLFLRHRNAAEVYLNGTLLAKHGKVGRSLAEESDEGSSEMAIPLQLHGGREYVLAIRFSTFHHASVFQRYSPNLLRFYRFGFTANIQDFARHSGEASRTRALRLIVAMIPLGILLFLSLQHGLMFVFSRRERLNLYVALFTFSMSLLCFSLSYRFLALTSVEILVWNEIFIPFEMALALLALHLAVDWVALGRRSAWWWRVTMPLALLVIVTRLLTTGDVWNYIVIVTLLLEFSLVAFILWKADAERRVGSSIIGAGLVICFFSGVAFAGMAILRLFDILWLYALVQYLMFLSMPVSLAFYTARRFDRINTELSKQLDYVQKLSEQALEQEQEKQRLMERQQEDLKRLVEERTEQLQAANEELSKQQSAVEQVNMQLLRRNVSIAAEQEKSEGLLLSILPAPIAKRLKQGEQTIADKYDDVTVLFADIAGFTRFASHIDPQGLVALLDKVFSTFDALAEEYGVEKIKTIGDAYMVVGGLDHHAHSGRETAAVMARMAIAMQDAICQLSEEMQVIGLTVRIGLHRGAAVAGVIGKKKPNYDLWGDTVNVASRMESHGEAGKIHVSEEFVVPLADRFIFRERGDIRIKGKGTMRTYFLEAERN